jgi:hypothetical protein
VHAFADNQAVAVGFSATYVQILDLVDAVAGTHTARIPSPLPLCVAKTGSNHLNEEFTLLLPTGIGERF